MKKLTFSPNFEVMFDHRGITELQSGTAPHHPDQTRFVIQNSEITRYTVEEDEACKKAADQGVAALAKWIRNNVAASDERAARALNFALSEQHG